tara:strand:- start:405 stop:1016 length:612 start_codon:yes stop_codon:yes gene_type:complete
MTTLQHTALDTLIKVGHKYDGENVIIENVIFEVDQLRQSLQIELDDNNEEYKFLQQLKNKKSHSNYTAKMSQITSEISRELFDVFSYSEAITSYEEVDWKEYFHCVYDHVIPEEKQSCNIRIWEIIPESPPALDVNSPCWSIVKSIKNNFEKFRIESEKGQTLKDIFKEQSHLGKEILYLGKEIVETNKTMAVYNRIIEWSMH